MNSVSFWLLIGFIDENQNYLCSATENRLFFLLPHAIFTHALIFFARNFYAHIFYLKRIFPKMVNHGKTQRDIRAYLKPFPKV